MSEYIAAPITIETEMEIRKFLWLGHGHTGVYGDDGEMQCSQCIQFGCSDYKRGSLEELVSAVKRVQESRLSLALKAIEEKPDYIKILGLSPANRTGLEIGQVYKVSWWFKSAGQQWPVVRALGIDIVVSKVTTTWEKWHSPEIANPKSYGTCAIHRNSDPWRMSCSKIAESPGRDIPISLVWLGSNDLPKSDLVVSPGTLIEVNPSLTEYFTVGKQYRVLDRETSPGHVTVIDDHNHEHTLSSHNWKLSTLAIDYGQI